MTWLSSYDFLQEVREEIQMAFPFLIFLIFPTFLFIFNDLHWQLYTRPLRLPPGE